MSRRQSYGDEEDIVVKPSTELIADEYEYSMETTNNIAVHTFASKSDNDQDNVNLFVETLKKNGYEIKPENKHCLENDNVDEILKNIAGDTEQLGGLILFFSGFSQSEGRLDMLYGKDFTSKRIQEIWNGFTSYSCLGLKNKPKIFIFHVTSPTTVQTDSRKYLSTTYDLAYETPAEADILIVYNKTERGYQRDFTDQLCFNIHRFGKHEDIISIVTCTDSVGFETRPMIISTMTRKFYFTVSESRGHHLSIDENNEQLVKDIREVHDKLSYVNKNPEKKKKFFSINLGRKSSVKKDPSKTVTYTEKVEESKEAPNPRNSNVKNPTAATPRTRTVSQTTDGGKSNLKKNVNDKPKPRWRNF